MFTVLGCIVQQHNPWLVALAAFLCGLACLTTCMVLSRAQAATGRARAAWTVLAAAEFGGGIWSLHFVAMLGYMPDLPIGYDPLRTALSVVVAVGGSLGAFAMLVQVPAGDARYHIQGLAGAALLLTAGIAGMHYTGVLAMRAPGTLVLDPVAAASSVALCAALVAPGVVVMRDLRRIRRQMAGSAMLGLAVCGLHFTGMAAVTIVPGLGPDAAEATSIDPALLAALVGALSVTTLLITLLLSVVDRRLSTRAVRERERLRQLVSVSFEGLVIERGGVMLDVNGRMCEMSGHDAPALVGQPFATLVPPEEAPGQGAARATDRRLHHRNGHMIPVELLVRAIEYEGGPATAIAVRDLTRHRRSEAALHRLAHFDPVTGLANRTLLNRRLSDAVMEAGVEGPVAVLCLNLDRFKGVNDLLGHATGDKLLVAVAERLGGLTRATDTLAHLGADEFAVVLPAPDGVMPIAIALATRIVSRLAEPFAIGGHQVTVGASVGVALHPSDGNTGEELLRCADIAMNCAKSGGRGAFRLFETQMDEELHERRTLERDLREAVEAGNLQLHYQPLVNCGSGAIEGYEALARWQHPGRGAVPPSVFIPLAESTGLILPLGQWVLEEACRAAMGWAVPVRVAVNLSPSQFREPDLAERIMATLERTGLPPRRLEVEVTEGVLIDDPDRAIAVLSTLRKAGVRVSLDDFGTGYSSLSYIRRFPLDKIKIDRSFIQEMGTDAQAASIVQALVGLAHTLNLSVTAEGVETAEQLGALRRQNCNQVQGYLLGRPAPNPGKTAGYLAETVPEPAMAG